MTCEQCGTEYVREADPYGTAILGMYSMNKIVIVKKPNKPRRMKMNKEKILLRKTQWLNWHKKNPGIWDAFEKFTLEAIQSGRK